MGDANLKVPLLLQGAVARSGDDRLLGAYCQERHVWMADGEPIVRGAALPEMLTKTDTIREVDDTRSPALLEMQTKTRAEVESDDDRFELSTALELLTKTLTHSERED